MKKFLAIWLGEFISNIGSGMTAFALSIYVYELTGSVAYVSIVALASFLPTILLNPLGGVLADRYDRRLLMIIGDLLSGLGVLFILLNIESGTPNIWYIILGAAFSGIFVALLEPSFKATITDLLPKEYYSKASGMVQISGNARYLLSPILAGILLSAYGIKLILIIDICTFFVTLIITSIVRKSITVPVKKEKKSITTDIKEGFQYLKSKKGIRDIVILMTLVCFFLGFIQTLIVPMVLDLSDTKTVGFLESACAVGMVISSIIIGIFGIRTKYVKTLSIAGMIASIFMTLTGTSVNLYVIGIAAFLFFFFLPFINTTADGLIRNNVENEIQGRIWGIISLISQAGTAIAYILSGVLADHIFEPLLLENGILTKTLGSIIGIGKGRGIGLMLIIAGIGMFITMFITGKNKNILKLEEKVKVKTV